MEFSSLEARLATFEPPSKRSKLGWPHKTPTAEELARAGFYYKPSSASNDNAICYLCERALDGWEPDDDPVQEHLKHASDCGWAILMDAGQDGNRDTNTLEDPTSEHFAGARRATFAIGWPHESKRGWTCKIEKMVEAGWHYAPTPDSDDFVSCTFCKLSLDGWEPKDNAFDEHYRRSPNCLFFHFAGTTAPATRPKAKKGRASRASRTSKVSTRLSTQSNNNTTLLSEAASIIDIPDFDESIDASTMSVMSTASTATTKGKRKGTAKTTKSKRAKTTRAAKRKVALEPETVEEADEETENPRAETAVEVASTLASQQAPPSPTPSPNAKIAYPSISNSPNVLSEIQRLSPLRAPPQHSPTPVKAKAPASATRSTATKQQTPRPPARASPSPTSDIENAPPSSRPASARPPITTTQKIPIAASSPGELAPTWTPADIELVFQATTPQPADLLGLTGGTLTADEKDMTVQEWIEHVAGQAESGLRAEAERVVGIFEREGQRAMSVLESVVCV